LVASRLFPLAELLRGWCLVQLEAVKIPAAKQAFYLQTAPVMPLRTSREFWALGARNVQPNKKYRWISLIDISMVAFDVVFVYYLHVWERCG
jgi:hypothetical protein